MPARDGAEEATGPTKVTEVTQVTEVTEVIELHARPGQGAALEAAVEQAAELFRRTGARAFDLARNVEDPDRYELRVVWATLEDHTVGFRSAPEFTAWRELVTPTLAQPPAAIHFSHLYTGF